MLSKDEFIARYQHKFLGLLFDAVTYRRTGGELSAWMSGCASDVRKELAAAYDSLQPKPNHEPLPANGVKVVAPVKGVTR